MSYRSREKKRRRNIAIGNAKKNHQEVMKGRHYLTITSRPCCCNQPECGRSLRAGDEMVFRFEPKEILCHDCAQRLRIKYRTSQKWDKAQRRRRGK